MEGWRFMLPYVNNIMLSEIFCYFPCGIRLLRKPRLLFFSLSAFSTRNFRLEYWCFDNASVILLFGIKVFFTIKGILQLFFVPLIFLIPHDFVRKFSLIDYFRQNASFEKCEKRTVGGQWQEISAYFIII